MRRSEVRQTLNMATVLRLVEDAFRQHGERKVQMPPKMYLTFDRYDGDLRIMPAYLPEVEAAGVKVVNVHPGNYAYSLPTVLATILINDPQTGRCLGVMDGSHVTNLRTGAGGGVAAKYLARPDSTIVGLIGVGVQAQTQLEALLELFPVRLVKAAGKTRENAEKFAAQMGAVGQVEIRPVDDVAEAADADIVCTTTPVRTPIVRREWIRPGTHINAIGADAPGKEELEPEILKDAKVVIDHWEQARHSGEINVPIAAGTITRRKIWGELGEIVAGTKPGRQSAEEITVFDSTGLAIQDVAVGKYVLDQAQARGLGMPFNFLD